MTDTDLAALLAGTRDVAPGLQPVADVLAALSAEPSLRELAGEARALAEFRHRTGVPVSRQHARRSTGGLTSRLSVKAAAGAAAATLVLGGAATAAFANMLPAPIQRLAHDVIGAPDAPSAPQRGPARGKPVAPGQVASHGTSKSSAKSQSTSRPGHGQMRTSQGQQGNGQGQQGTGQGQQGRGQSGAGHQGRPGAGHPGPRHHGEPGAGQPGTPGAGRSGQPGAGPGWLGNGLGNPHAMRQYGDPHFLWQLDNPHPPAAPVAHHGWLARHRPARHT